MSTQVAISYRDLTKHFGSLHAVEGLTLDVYEGEIFGLLGPNGAGKSTTLYMTTGLVRPTRGRVVVFGHDVRSDFLRAVQCIGAMVEEPRFCEYLSARANLEMFARLAGPGTRPIEAAEAVGLAERLDDKVRHFSHGMKQRLGIAQALLGRPRILILDEPTSGLDPEGTRDILRLIHSLARERGLTIVLSSHQLHEVEAICDRVAIVRRGQLVACDRIDTLLAGSGQTLWVRAEPLEGALELVRSLNGVSAVREAPGGRMVVELSEATPDEINARLVQAGFRVAELSLKRPTLEEFFLRVAGREVHEAPEPVRTAAESNTPHAVEAEPTRGDTHTDVGTLPSRPVRVLNQVRNEVRKIRGQRLPYVLLGLIVATCSLHLLGKYLGEPDLDRNGFSFVLLSVQLSLSFLGSLFLLALAASMIAGEVGNGAVRMFVSRPIGRVEYFAAKAITAALVTAATVVVALLAAFAVAAPFMNFGDLMDGDILIYSRSTLFENLLLGCAAVVVTLYGAVSFGLMVSAFARGSGAAISTAIGVYLLLDVSKRLIGIQSFLFTSYIDAPLVQLADLMDGLDFRWGTALWRALAVASLSSLVFLASGALTFRRRDLNG